MDLRDIVAMFQMERDRSAGWLSLHYDGGEAGGGSNLSSMYYLLAGDEPLPAHKLQGLEVWHHHLGAPAELTVAVGGGDAQVSLLGTDLAAGQRPQLAVPAWSWLSCRSLGAWTLFGRVQSPGFSSRAAVVLSADV